jgi:hypothetical protein
MEIDLTKNFNEIYEALFTKKMNVTGIAKAMGYTTSAQLHSALKGESMLSTKAIISLIQNANVNPTYLFLGKGEMFGTDESELENLRKNCSEWERKYFTVQDELFKCKAELERAIHRYNKLIDITSIALDKTQKSDKQDDKESKSE